MTILLTNDDGYKADGINSLIAPLEAKGHEVWMMAPSGNRSAQSHAMKLYDPITVTRISENRYHNNGNPTDCVMYAARSSIFPHLPDLVISGINHGYNCSTDIIYSGTCAAACEAVLQGIKGIALSLEPGADGTYDFTECARWTADNLDKLCMLAGDESFVNVNFPPAITGGVSATGLGYFTYPDVPTAVSGDDEMKLFELMSAISESRRVNDDGSYCDFHATEKGEVAISVIKVLPTLDLEKQALIGELFK